MPFAGIPGWAGRTGSTLAEDLDLLDRLSDERFTAAALEFTCSSLYASRRRPAARSGAARARPGDGGDPRPAAGGLHRSACWTTRRPCGPGCGGSWRTATEAFFADTWQRIRVQLAADARHKAELLRRKGLGEAVHGGVGRAEPGRERDANKRGQAVRGPDDRHRPGARRRLTFVPTSFGWPHLMVLHAPGWRPVIHYPVHGPELPSPASVELLKLRMEALAHPMRMRLCRNLARSPNTTSELADAHGITAPEVSRHLAVLKKAGLITTRRRGRYVLHQLDLTVVARLGSDFLEGVLR